MTTGMMTLPHLRHRQQMMTMLTTTMHTLHPPRHTRVMDTMTAGKMMDTGMVMPTVQVHTVQVHTVQEWQKTTAHRMQITRISQRCTWHMDPSWRSLHSFSSLLEHLWPAPPT